MDIDIEQDLKEIKEQLAKEDKEGIKESRFFPHFKTAISLLLAILMISFILIDPNVRDVIAGFFESEAVRENEFNYGDKTIMFAGNNWKNLVSLFRENQENEFRACLEGEIKGNKYIVAGIILPEIYFRTVYQVRSSPCPKNTIIDLHSHPYQKCVASDTDLKTLEKEKQVNPEIIMAVMCTEERISFYG